MAPPHHRTQPAGIEADAYSAAGAAEFRPASHDAAVQSTPAPQPAGGSGVLARMLAATLAAATAAWLAAHLMSPSALTPGALALVSWLVVAAAPRTGWLLATATVATALAVDGRTGAGVVVVAMALVPVVLVPRRPSLWPVVAVAPGLGVIGLAGAWPGLAGYARTTLQRAGVAAAGFLWLVAAGGLTGRIIYAHVPPASAPWTASLHGALHNALSTIFSPGPLAAAAVWALAAAVLPTLPRPGLTPVALALLAAWATATAVATVAALRWGGGWDPAVSAAPLIGGAVAASLVGLAFRIGSPFKSRAVRIEQPVRLP